MVKCKPYCPLHIACGGVKMREIIVIEPRSVYNAMLVDMMGLSKDEPENKLAQV